MHIYIYIVVLYHIPTYHRQAYTSERHHARSPMATTKGRPLRNTVSVRMRRDLLSQRLNPLKVDRLELVLH